MKCDNCIHKFVCYKIGSILPAYVHKCGDFKDDNSIVPVKPMVEIDLYSVIKQKYIERDVLDKIRAEIDKIYERENHSFDCLDALDELKEFIDKRKEQEEV